jgi:F-type H+-transporting ATPase subunit a
MPEHISLLHYALYRLEFLRADSSIKHSLLFHRHLGYKDYEPVFMALVLMLVIVYLASEVRGVYKRMAQAKKAEELAPEEELTLQTFFEVFFEFFYNMAKDVMGPKNAKRYFALIGASAIFIFVSNAMGLVPGMLPPTSNLNVTAGCALVVFIAFNYYGIKENGMGYIKHMAGWGTFHSPLPNLLLALLMLPIELISITVRPITLSIRLMMNMAVDHLLVSLFAGFFAILVPLPIMLLGIIVIVVQTLVFCLLTSIYIGLATEHAEHH